ncbi:MAG TPA: hypothetical protein VGR10_04020 [Thermoleophilaceae bacterium]|nr:hypothetical protein [Thermoleophilaceae bacterium]
MLATLTEALLILQTESPGRGEDVGGAGGVLIVIGIALLALAIVGGAGFLLLRGYRERRAADRSGETVRRKTASEEGRPFSSDQ